MSDLVLRGVPRDVLVCGTLELVVGPLDGALDGPPEGPFAPIMAAAAPFALFSVAADDAVAPLETQHTVCFNLKNDDHRTAWCSSTPFPCM